MAATLFDLCPEIINDAPFQDDAFLQFCKQTLVEKALVCIEKSSIQVNMSAPFFPCLEVRIHIKKVLCAQLPSLDVTLNIHFPLHSLTKESLLSLVDELEGKAIASKCYLMHCTLAFQGDTLHIHIPHSAKLLHALHFSASLESLLQKYTGETVQVIIREENTAPVTVLEKRAERKRAENEDSFQKTVSLQRWLPKDIADRFAEKLPCVLYGRSFVSEKIESIDELEEGTRRCTVMGEVFFFEKEEKKKCIIITAGLDDEQGTICLKWLIWKGGTVPKPIRIGDTLVVKGEHSYDPYRREMVIFPTNVMRLTKKELVDSAKVPRVELHLHTKSSAMDALCDVKEAVQLACQMGHRALTITDHGVVQAFPEAMFACDKARETHPDFKIIYGCEVYYVPDNTDDHFSGSTKKPRSNFHMILLAQTQAGLKNLYRIISESHLTHYHTGRGAGPRVPKKLLDANREGLLVGSACEAGELYQALEHGYPEERILEIAAYYDFLEIQPIQNNAFLLRDCMVSSQEVLCQFNKTIVEIGKHLQKPVVASGDVHFLRAEDNRYRIVLQAAQGYTDADAQPPLFYRTTGEMLSEFPYLDEQDAYDVVVRWPNEIADKVEADIRPIPMDRLYIPSIEGSEAMLKEMVLKNAHRRFGETVPDLVQTRLQAELDGIIGAGYAVLYIIAQKLVAHSEENGYQVGSRGSVGSSAVAHFAGISEVNPLPPHYLCPQRFFCEFIADGSITTGFDLPLKTCPHCKADLIADGHDIPFETFLGFGGNKVPDIDLNFSGEHQALAHKYTEELFGKENVFRAGTVMALADKTAQSYAYRYLAERGKPTSDMDIKRLATGVSGVKKTSSQHPGAMVVLPKGYDIHDFTPLQYPANDASKGVVTTHFEFEYLHDTLLKLDELGHVVPTLYKYLEQFSGICVNDVPTTDSKVFSLLTGTEALGVSAQDIDSKTGTFGIPELGTPLVRQMLCEARPQSFGDLIQISGLSHGTGVWKGNAQSLIQSGRCTISEVIGTRDSIMLYLIRKGIEAKTAFALTEKVRKGKAHKLGFTEEEEALLKKHDVPSWYIESCKKIEYMFPKAHAVAYLIAATRIMWYKVYHPKAFYAAYFTARGKGMDYDLVMQGKHAVKRKMMELKVPKQKGGSVKDEEMLTALQVANECLCRNILFLPVETGRSFATRYGMEEEGIRMPYASIAGIGNTVAAQLEATARMKQTYSSIEDFAQDTKLNTAALSLLEEAGIFAGLAASSQLSF